MARANISTKLITWTIFLTIFIFFRAVNIQLLQLFATNMVALLRIYSWNCFNFGFGFQWRKFLHFIREIVKGNGTLLSRWIVDEKRGRRHIEVVEWQWALHTKKSFQFESTFPCWKIICFIFCLEQNNFFHPFVRTPSDAGQEKDENRKIVTKQIPFFFYLTQKGLKLSANAQVESSLLFYQRVQK